MKLPLRVGKHIYPVFNSRRVQLSLCGDSRAAMTVISLVCHDDGHSARVCIDDAGAGCGVV